MTKSEIVIRPHELVKELVPGYLENRKREISVLKDSLEKGDFNTISRIAHNISGTASGYGFNGMHSISLALENAATVGDHSLAEEALSELDLYLNNVKVSYGD